MLSTTRSLSPNGALDGQPEPDAQFGNAAMGIAVDSHYDTGLAGGSI